MKHKCRDEFCPEEPLEERGFCEKLMFHSKNIEFSWESCSLLIQSEDRCGNGCGGKKDRETSIARPALLMMRG